MLELRVMDRDRGDDDFLGRIRLDAIEHLTAAANGTITTRQLRGRKAGAGRLTFSVSLKAKVSKV